MMKEFDEITVLIVQAQQRTVQLINKELLGLYWQIGAYIHQKTQQEVWGKQVVRQLAEHLHLKFPSNRGFSAKNLWRMKQLYETYHVDEKLSPLVRQIAWTQNMVILARTNSPGERTFYLQGCARERWSKRELERQITSSLYERSLLSSPAMSEALLQTHPTTPEVFRDPYMLEFLDLPKIHSENDLQKAIVHNLGAFILEAGRDFSLIGEEYRVQVGMEDFYIDLLLFHRGLQCLVAVELKIEHFKPEHLGQLNFYLEALDRDVRKPHENPSVGIILCKSKDEEVVEYALSRQLSPALVAQYKTELIEREMLRMKLKELFLLADRTPSDEG